MAGVKVDTSGARKIRNPFSARTGSIIIPNMRIPTAVVLKQNDFNIIFPVLDVYRVASLVKAIEPRRSTFS